MPFSQQMPKTGVVREQSPIASAAGRSPRLARVAACWSIAALWLFVDPRVAIAWLFLAPLAGALALNYWRQARRVARLLYHETRMLLQRDELAQLRTQRTALRERLTEMADEFESVSPSDAA